MLPGKVSHIIEDEDILECDIKYKNPATFYVWSGINLNFLS